MPVTTPNTIVPQVSTLKKTDYGDDGLGSKEALDKFFNQQNQFQQGTKSALAGGLTIGNFNGALLTFTVIAPPTPAPIAPSFLNGWSVFIPGQTDVTYQKTAEGNVILQGAVKGGTLATPGVPSDIFQLPATFKPLQDVNIETTLGTSGVCQMRILSTTGMVSQLNPSNIGLGAPGLDNHFMSLSCVFQAAVLDSPILPAFSDPNNPFLVQIPAGKTPTDLWCTSAIDTKGNTCAPSVAWQKVNQKPGGQVPNMIKINDVRGLTPGATWTVRAIVLFQ